MRDQKHDVAATAMLTDSIRNAGVSVGLLANAMKHLESPIYAGELAADAIKTLKRALIEAEGAKLALDKLVKQKEDERGRPE